MKKVYIIILALSISLKMVSQDAPIIWKEIPIDDLKMTEFPDDTSANAVILCDYGKYYFDVNPNGRSLFLFNDRHIRIKILKPGGIKYAHVRLPYKDMTCEQMPGENSIIIKGMTYNLDDKGEIIATRLKQKNIKRTDSVGCIRIAEFDLPDVKPGSVIEYQVSIPTLDLISPANWYFQNDIPTLYSEFRFRIPAQFNYLISPQNFTGFDISEEKHFNQSIMYYHPYLYRYRRYNSPLALYGTQIRLVKTGIEKFECQNFTYNHKDLYQSIKIHLVRAVRENMDYLLERMTHALAITTAEDYDLHSPSQRSLITYPAAYIFYNLPDWEKMNKNLLKSDRFGLALIKHWNYEQILQEIIKDKEDPEQKLIAVYDFIRKNMKWTGQYSLLVDPVFNNSLSKLYTRITKKLGNEKSLRKPFEERTGSSSEINFLLIYLLNKAGIEAHPVIISTRNHGKIDSLIPDPKQFNHVIALATINEKPYFLDATDSLRPYNILDINDLTLQGFLIKPEGFGWITVKNNEPSNLNIAEQIKIDSEFNISSKIKVNENGYFALAHRNLIANQGKDSLIKNISEKYNGFGQSSNIQIEGPENDKFPIVFESSRTGKIESNDEHKIHLNFEPVVEADEFNDFIRKYPVTFNYPFSISYQMELSVPEGFEIELPEPGSFTTYGGNAVYQYKTNKENNKILLSINIDLKINEFPQHEYNNLAQLFGELDEKIKEEIRIKKL